MESRIPTPRLVVYVTLKRYVVWEGEGTRLALLYSAWPLSIDCELSHAAIAILTMNNYMPIKYDDRIVSDVRMYLVLGCFTWISFHAQNWCKSTS